MGCRCEVELLAVDVLMEHKSSLQCLTSTNCISLARQSSMSTTCILVLLLLGSLFLESIRSQESHVQKLTYGKLCLYYTDPHTPASWVPACSTCGTYMQWVLEVLCQCCIPFCEIATTQLAVDLQVWFSLSCAESWVHVGGGVVCQECEGEEERHHHRECLILHVRMPHKDMYLPHCSIVLVC